MAIREISTSESASPAMPSSSQQELSFSLAVQQGRHDDVRAFITEFSCEQLAEEIWKRGEEWTPLEIAAFQDD